MDPQVNAFAAIGDITALGTTVLTDLAKYYEQFPGNKIVADCFPTRTTMDQTVMIERVIEGVGIAPLVTPGKNDVLTDNPQVEQMTVVPAFLRESDFITSNIVNNLRKVGTLNEREGREIIARRIKRMTNRINRAWEVFMAQMLLGGINYTDPRTKAKLNVSANIPAANLRAYNGAQPFTGWSDQTNSTPVSDLINFRQYLYNQSKVKPNTLVMTSDLRTVLQQNAEILKRQEVSFLSQTGYVTIKDGELVAIAGMTIETYDMVYQNPVDGTVTKVWPINKVAVLAKNHPVDTEQTIGRMVKCVGEDPQGRPGLWVRSGPDTQPPAAPGRSVQMGDSGLPFLVYPDWVGIMTVDSVNNLMAVLGYDTGANQPLVNNQF